MAGNSSVSTGYRLVDRGTMPSRVKVPFATKFRLVPSQCIVLLAASSKQRRILECMGHYLQSPTHRNVPVFKLRASYSVITGDFITLQVVSLTWEGAGGQTEIRNLVSGLVK